MMWLIFLDKYDIYVESVILERMIKLHVYTCICTALGTIYMQSKKNTSSSLDYLSNRMR